MTQYDMLLYDLGFEFTKHSTYRGWSPLRLILSVLSPALLRNCLRLVLL